MCSVLLAVVLMAVSPWASAAPDSRVRAQPEARHNKNTDEDGMANLKSILDAAAARKRMGTDVLLPGLGHLHGRPTAEAVNMVPLPAGTKVRRSNQRVTNAAGTWRHVNIEDRDGGWILESELPD